MNTLFKTSPSAVSNTCIIQSVTTHLLASMVVGNVERDVAEMQQEKARRFGEARERNEDPIVQLRRAMNAGKELFPDGTRAERTARELRSNTIPNSRSLFERTGLEKLNENEGKGLFPDVPYIQYNNVGGSLVNTIGPRPSKTRGLKIRRKGLRHRRCGRNNLRLVNMRGRRIRGITLVIVGVFNLNREMVVGHRYVDEYHASSSEHDRFLSHWAFRKATTVVQQLDKQFSRQFSPKLFHHLVATLGHSFLTDLCSARSSQLERVVPSVNDAFSLALHPSFSQTSTAMIQKNVKLCL